MWWTGQDLTLITIRPLIEHSWSQRAFAQNIKSCRIVNGVSRPQRFIHCIFMLLLLHTLVKYWRILTSGFDIFPKIYDKHHIVMQSLTNWPLMCFVLIPGTAHDICSQKPILKLLLISKSLPVAVFWQTPEKIKRSRVHKWHHRVIASKASFLVSNFPYHFCRLSPSNSLLLGFIHRWFILRYPPLAVKADRFKILCKSEWNLL